MVTGILTGLGAIGILLWAIGTCLLLLATEDERPRHWPLVPLLWPLVLVGLFAYAGAIDLCSFVWRRVPHRCHETMPSMPSLRCALRCGHEGRHVVERHFEGWWRRWERIQRACYYAGQAALIGGIVAFLATDDFAVFPPSWLLGGLFHGAGSLVHRHMMKRADADIAQSKALIAAIQADLQRRLERILPS
jgi:hypothetical protein